MELIDIKIFCDLIELKSFTEAAKKNCLTQSAVSQRINRLNEYYGNKIFLDRKRLALSWHGKYLYEKFKDILKIYSLTEEIIDNKYPRDVVSIGFSNNARLKYFNRGLVDDVLRKNILPEIYFGPSRSIYEKVLFGALDYGVIGNMPHRSNALEYNQLYAEKIVLVTHHKNSSESINIEEIPFIFDHRDSGLYLFLKDELSFYGKNIGDLNIKAYVGTSIDKLSILQDSNCYSFLPESYVKDKSSFKIIPLEFDLERSFYEIYLKKKRKEIALVSMLISKSNSV